ncbi:DUF6153 family protein [Streptomyces sp. H10-C2]|uniref:DUF6153 family protein n=1 Tax=unclassified Streptomyces TaxID=2593676 RepID=UPI0024B985FB|nr:MULTISPECIES: DUF6153 family protein [unclassified Streptomyces]MDJ0347321.1 DUF6153 family protein [Streptomyces sp. PH10-H1]MDJ0375118.1 DUF6153 family protein [Streptomyces sp. H10-C2]
MSGVGHGARVQRLVRARTLLVLVVLAGILAMHGMGSHTAMAATAEHPMAAHMRQAGAPSGAAAPIMCGSCGQGAGGHAHADELCVSNALPDTPALPAPAPAPVQVALLAQVCPVAAADAAGGRAPPSLAELQILRV